MWLLMEVPSRSWSGVVSLELGPVAPIRARTDTELWPDTGPLSGVPPGLEGPDIKHGHISIIMLTMHYGKPGRQYLHVIYSSL